MPSREDYERAMDAHSVASRERNWGAAVAARMEVNAYVAQLERPLSDEVAEAVADAHGALDEALATSCDLNRAEAIRRAKSVLDTITRALRGEE